MEVALPHNSSSSGDAKQIVPSGSMVFFSDNIIL